MLGKSITKDTPVKRQYLKVAFVKKNIKRRNCKEKILKDTLIKKKKKIKRRICKGKVLKDVFVRKKYWVKCVCLEQKGESWPSRQYLYKLKIDICGTVQLVVCLHF